MLFLLFYILMGEEVKNGMTRDGYSYMVVFIKDGDEEFRFFRSLEELNIWFGCMRTLDKPYYIVHLESY